MTAADAPVAAAYAAEAGRLIALGRLLCGDAQAGEDLAHDVFLDAMRQSRRDPDYLREPVWPWLRVALVRRATRWRQRRLIELRALVRSRDIAALEGWADSTTDLMRALRGLPPRMRACVSLFYLEDLSVEQTAELLDCAPRTVETQLRLGRRRLAALLGDQADLAGEDLS
jgi:RNA polymerase sigma factor (sigma-70 family)